MVYTRYAEKQHEGWRNLGSRFANEVADRAAGQAEGALSLLLPLHVARSWSRRSTRYRGPYPYVDGLIMQVTQRIDSIEVRHLPRAEGRSNYTI